MERIKIFVDPDGTLGLNAGLHVLVARKTGVVYEHQCAGFLNDQRSLEGFLVPVGGADEASSVYGWFWKHFKGNCYPSEYFQWSERPDLVAELNELVGRIAFWHNDKREVLELDTGRIDECVEAWIPVRTGYGPGVLILHNSD